MAKEKSKRKQIIVKRTLQLKYAATVLIAMLVTAVTVGADFYIRVYGLMKDFLKDLPAHNIEHLMMNMNQLMYAKIIVLLVIALVISVYVSHKFAGPIVNIEKNIAQVAEGDLSRKVYFRTGDDLKHLADYFNYMTGKIKGTVESDRKIIGEVMKKLEALKIEVAGSEMRDRIEGMQSRLQKVTEYWKV